MKNLVLLVLFIFSISEIKAQSFYGDNPLAHTYSIVALDPETGDMGVAVQSHWFLVGPLVAWGKAGVGVVATQSFINVSFGPRGLELLEKGFTPQQVVDTLLSTDEGRDVRQLAVLDITGDAASYTGKNCIPFAGNIVGENYSVQANLMLTDDVPTAMAKSFESSNGPLAERLVAALIAAESAGGDIRGKQSAALLVVRGKSTGKIWEDVLVDLRVDDNPNPNEELERLLKVHRAYEHMNNGDLAIEHGDMKKAVKEYGLAEEMFPDNEEMKYWHAITLIENGKLNEALPILKEVFHKNNNWRILTPRLREVNLLNVTDEELEKILEL